MVSGTPIVIYDPTRENVLAHEFVNETVMREYTVIPMSFGTIFRTDDDIIELLRSTYHAFNDVLEKMQDKIEFGLKVLWDRDQVIRELEEEDEEIRRLKDEITVAEARPTSRACSSAGWSKRRWRRRPTRYVAETSTSAAASPSRSARTSRSATA